MPLTPEMVSRWRRERGDWLYHCALDQAIPWIKRDGLVPRQATGVRPNHPDLPSRPDRVYLMANDLEDEVGLAGVGRPNVRVEMSQLDPALLGSDEDVISSYETDHAAVAHLPGADQLLWPHNQADVTAWAMANAAVIDQQDWVWFSLHRGRVSYAGAIPPAAFEIYPGVSALWDVAPPNVPFVARRWVDGEMPYQRKAEG